MTTQRMWNEDEEFKECPFCHAGQDTFFLTDTISYFYMCRGCKCVWSRAPEVYDALESNEQYGYSLCTPESKMVKVCPKCSLRNVEQTGEVYPAWSCPDCGWKGGMT